MAASDFSSYLEELGRALKPYREEVPTFSRIPETGLSKEEVIRLMEGLWQREEARWKEGFASGAVYHGDQEHIGFLNRVYGINSQSNPLHFDLWPSTVKYEAEIVSMTAHMLGADRTTDRIVGTISSGGTESILLAMKTYRDWARDRLGITEPEMVVPSTAHAAFDKAAQYFNIKIIRVPVGEDYRADVKATRQAVTENTIVLVGSAPSFPHGMIDPIEELSELARERGIGFHTDACLGGFLLPWAEKLGYDVPPFDFRLPGVTSISADTHKYGYAAKGSSVILYRSKELLHYQYFITTDWSGGLYLSPTLAGSRPGALSATCWAAMVATGQQGYMEAASKILQTAATIRAGIEEIPELKVFGNPLFVIAFGSDVVDIYAVNEYMTRKGWGLNALQDPPAVHICVTLRHTQPGVAGRFIQDLREAVAYVKEHPGEGAGIGAIYGMTANVALRGAVEEFLKAFLDIVYEP